MKTNYMLFLIRQPVFALVSNFVEAFPLYKAHILDLHVCFTVFSQFLHFFPPFFTFVSRLFIRNLDGHLVLTVS